VGAERLAGRRIVVVGGGQQDYGIEDPPLGNGRAMSVLFAREGAAVAVCDLEEASAEATAELVRAEGAQAVTIAGDAADEDAVVRMLDEASSGLGGLDGIVLNVGVAGGLGLQGTTVEDWDRVMAVNARAHFLGLKHGLPRLREGGGGSIVLTGSLASRETMPSPAYAASKSALESLVRNGAIEGAPSVRVNLLIPGLIDTPLGRLATKLAPQRAEVHIPLDRQGTPWEVANAALFLMGDESSYMTGQSLVVDGGLGVAFRT
jgi:NAD(P)-dependent dehydrogenase (short-subunit alcohol dehydrogenase family)